MIENVKKLDLEKLELISLAIRKHIKIIGVDIRN